MITSPGADTRIAAMLDAAGLDPDPAEREEMRAIYEQFKPGVEALYALPQARYESPALVFQAEPLLRGWRT
jgi:hypothetical protein